MGTWDSMRSVSGSSTGAMPAGLRSAAKFGTSARQAAGRFSRRPKHQHHGKREEQCPARPAPQMPRTRVIWLVLLAALRRVPRHMSQVQHPAHKPPPGRLLGARLHRPACQAAPTCGWFGVKCPSLRQHLAPPPACQANPLTCRRGARRR
jgi:hypothetical protein